MKVYASTPSRLRRLTTGLTDRQIRKSPGKGRWSIAFLISHFCDAEWAHGFRIRKAIAEPGGRFQAYDQDRWAKHLYYDKADWKQKLDLFEALRGSHVSLLQSLSAREWQLFGIHEERGKETVERMIQMLAGHDVNHLTQMKAIRSSLLKK